MTWVTTTNKIDQGISSKRTRIHRVNRSIHPNDLIHLMSISWSFSFLIIALKMREYESLLTRISPYEHRIVNFDFTRENISQRKPVFSHTLRSECFVNLERYSCFFFQPIS